MTGDVENGGPVQVFVDLTRFAATATRAQLHDRSAGSRTWAPPA